MSTSDRDPQKSHPREIRIKGLNGRPGIVKSILSFGLLVLIILIFILVFVTRSLW